MARIWPRGVEPSAVIWADSTPVSKNVQLTMNGRQQYHSNIPHEEFVLRTISNQSITIIFEPGRREGLSSVSVIASGDGFRTAAENLDRT